MDDAREDTAQADVGPSAVPATSRSLRWPYAASIMLLGATAIATAFIAPTLPEMMPVHWDITFRPDRWEPAAPWGAFVPVALGVILVGLCMLAERLDPRVSREPALRWLPAGSALGIAVLCSVFTVAIWIQAGIPSLG